MTTMHQSDPLISEDERRYRELLQDAPTIVWMVDENGNGVFANHRWTEVTGQTLEESLGSGWTQVIHSDDADRVHEIFQTACKTQSVYFAEYRLRTASGEYRWVIDTASPRIGKDGAFLGYIGGIVEIHERRMAEKALFLSNERFKAAIQAVEGVMWTTDAQGDFVDLQPQWERITGQSFDEYKGKGWSKAIHPDDIEAYLSTVATSVTHGGTLDTTHRLKSASGAWRRYAVRACPVHNQDGSIREWVGVHTDVTERWEYRTRIEYLATHDALTHLPNRLLFNDRLDHLVQQRGDRKHAVLFMDLNRFKFINDSLGHDVGDKLLIEVASILRSNMRAGDTVARFGGDEFVFLLEDIKSQTDISRIAQKILALVAKPIRIGEHELSVTGSIGASLYPRDGQTRSELLRNADQAMYQAKATGQSSIEFFDKELNDGMLDRIALENDLRDAVKNKELVLHYQPKMHVSENRVFCLEALVRWNHPVRGLVPPLEFIPLAEESGLISQIGDWVLEEACRQLNSWKEQGMRNIRISVNLSVHQLKSPYYLQNLKKALKRTTVDVHCLELEITESALMENIRSCESLLQEIRALGIRLAIDDFGTGYSSLSYLKKLPIQTLKIDRSFIQNVIDNKDDAAIVCATISMAQRMGLSIIAEGVETKEHVDFLQQNGCELMQGYYFSRPLPASQIEAFLKKHIREGDHHTLASATKR